MPRARGLAWLGAGLIACAQASAAAPRYRVEALDLRPDGGFFERRDAEFDDGSYSAQLCSYMPGGH